MDNEQLLYMIIGQKEKELTLAKMMIRQQAEQIKALQEKVSGLNPGADSPQKGDGS